MIREWQRARRRHRKTRRLARSHRRVLRLRRDGGRNALGELNLVHRAVNVTVESSFEVIKRAVARDLQIHWKVSEGSEELGSRSRGIQCSNPANTKIRIKIFTAVLRGKLKRCRVVKNSGSDGATHFIAVETVTVRVKRTLKPRIARHAFSVGPTVVCARDASIELFPCFLADVVDEHADAVSLANAKL